MCDENESNKLGRRKKHLNFSEVPIRCCCCNVFNHIKTTNEKCNHFTKMPFPCC